MKFCTAYPPMAVVFAVIFGANAGLIAHDAGAQQPTAAPQTFWDIVHAQDPYFNKSGSVLPQRYTLTSAVAPRPVARPATQPAAAHVTTAQMQPAAQSAMPTAQAPYVQGKDQLLGGMISEIRFAVLSHDAKFPSRHGFDAPNPFENRYESGINLNPEVVFPSPDWLDWMWAPQPHLGASLNTSGDTSSVYTGLGWDTAWDNGIFLDGFFGLAAHDGELRDGNNKGKIEFGSRVLFRLGGELGWRWDDHNGIGLLWEHMSNGGIFSSKNQGIDSLGLRYSYRFSTPN